MTIKPYPFEPDYAVPPSETIRECIKAKGWTQAGFARIIGRSVSFVGRLCRNERKIDVRLARDLESALGVPGTFWLNREKNYRKALKRLSGQEHERG